MRRIPLERIYLLKLSIGVLFFIAIFVPQILGDTKPVRVTTVGTIGGSSSTNPGVLTGRVADSEGNVLDNLSVTLKGIGAVDNVRGPHSLTLRKTTPKNGFYKFEDVKPGRYKLSIYEGETAFKQSEEVELNSGETKEVNFTIESLPAEPKSYKVQRIIQPRELKSINVKQ